MRIKIGFELAKQNGVHRMVDPLGKPGVIGSIPLSGPIGLQLRLENPDNPITHCRHLIKSEKWYVALPKEVAYSLGLSPTSQTLFICTASWPFLIGLTEVRPRPTSGEIFLRGLDVRRCLQCRGIVVHPFT